LIYILVREQETVTTLSGGVLGTIILIKNDTSLPIMTTILLIIEALAWILATDAIKYDKMYFEIRRIKDDSEERTLLLAEKNKSIDLIPMLEKTKYKTDGMGGIITNGTMYVGFPR